MIQMLRPDVVRVIPLLLAGPEVFMVGRLSARETEVLTLAASGLTYKEIAMQLGISTRTARNHLAHIYGKLGIHDRAQATLHAARMGLV